MAQQKESERGEHSEFPVDTKPLIRSLLLFLLVFIGLCAVVYLQNSAEMWGTGNLLLAAAICFFAYTQRQDSFRMTCILVGGLLLCGVLYLMGGGEMEEEAVEAPRPARRSSGAVTPEGFGQ